MNELSNSASHDNDWSCLEPFDLDSFRGIRDIKAKWAKNIATAQAEHAAQIAREMQWAIDRNAYDIEAGSKETQLRKPHVFPSSFLAEEEVPEGMIIPIRTLDSATEASSLPLSQQEKLG